MLSCFCSADTKPNETGSVLNGPVQNQLPRSASTQDVRRQRAVQVGESFKIFGVLWKFKIIRFVFSVCIWHRVSQELLTTERNYVDDLLMVAANFRQPLLAASAIDEREAEVLECFVFEFPPNSWIFV
jgi:hypothetical protein